MIFLKKSTVQIPGDWYGATIPLPVPLAVIAARLARHVCHSTFVCLFARLLATSWQFYRRSVCWLTFGRHPSLDTHPEIFERFFNAATLGHIPGKIGRIFTKILSYQLRPIHTKRVYVRLRASTYVARRASIRRRASTRLIWPLINTAWSDVDVRRT